MVKLAHKTGLLWEKWVCIASPPGQPLGEEAEWGKGWLCSLLPYLVHGLEVPPAGPPALVA